MSTANFNTLTRKQHFYKHCLNMIAKGTIWEREKI